MGQPDRTDRRPQLMPESDPRKERILGIYSRISQVVGEAFKGVRPDWQVPALAVAKGIDLYAGKVKSGSDGEAAEGSIAHYYPTKNIVFFEEADMDRMLADGKRGEALLTRILTEELVHAASTTIKQTDTEFTLKSGFVKLYHKSEAEGTTEPQSDEAFWLNRKDFQLDPGLVYTCEFTQQDTEEAAPGDSLDSSDYGLNERATKVLVYLLLEDLMKNSAGERLVPYYGTMVFGFSDGTYIQTDRHLMKRNMSAKLAQALYEGEDEGKQILKDSIVTSRGNNRQMSLFDIFTSEEFMSTGMITDTVARDLDGVGHQGELFDLKTHRIIPSSSRRGSNISASGDITHLPIWFVIEEQMRQRGQAFNE